MRASAVPAVSWPELRARFDWRQGEHVTLIGPTGTGKTTLAIELLDRRDYVVVAATKPRDRTFAKLTKPPRRGGLGFKLDRAWAPNPELHPKVVLWPPIRRREDAQRQRSVFGSMLDGVFRTGGWTVVLDELRYITDPRYLGLASHVELLWQQGRAMGVSIVAATQRPRHVPLVAYDQVTHLFIWRENDAANLRRLGELSGVDTQLVQREVPLLDGHDFLYVNTRTGEVVRSNVRT